MLTVNNKSFSIMLSFGLIIHFGCIQNPEFQIEFIPYCSAPTQILVEGNIMPASDSSKITLMGKEAKIFNRVRKRFRDQNIPSNFSSFNLQMLTPDGWVSLPSFIRGKNNVYRIGFDINNSSMVNIKFIDLYVDNRGGKECEFGYGQMKIILKENVASELHIPAAKEPNNSNVSLNNNHIGTMTAARLASSNNYLIDCSGIRSYHLHRVDYSRYGLSSSKGITDLYYKGNYVHYLSSVEISYFLESAPSKIETYNTVSDFRWELVEIK